MLHFITVVDSAQLHCTPQARARSGENQRLVNVVDEPVEVHRDFRRMTNPLRGMYRMSRVYRMNGRKTGGCQHVTGWI